MVKMISIVRTVILCLAVCDVCWTRYLALDDDTEDSYLPETEVPFKEKLPSAAENLLLLRLIKSYKKNSKDDADSESPEKRQRRCYWSPVACYG
uniref:Uncharacterized protein n=1 Tax=Magallana gigas TaxID=29159 RepID=A0A8W8JRE1_MAGGI|nr:uncharacterized protein LOC105345370 isoform X2 [Crassostrea gigas]|eukprot:XP_011451798.1 PREDICTED: uncharacterized protein LOC105345370 isoform X2 [Crassostrea gigas]